jgi:excisionase family DNA binding protein
VAVAVKNQAAPIEPKLCISVPEAARQLGISRAHAFQMAGTGTLPTVRFGKRLVVPILALERVLEGASQPHGRNGQA